MEVIVARVVGQVVAVALVEQVVQEAERLWVNEFKRAQIPHLPRYRSIAFKKGIFMRATWLIF